MGFASHTFLFRCADQMLCHLSTNGRMVLSTSAEPPQTNARPGDRQRCGPGPGSPQTGASWEPLALLPAVPHASYCAGSGWEESLRHRCDSRSRKVTCITRAGACPGSPDCLWREEKPCSCISRLKTMLFSPTSPEATTQHQHVPVHGSNAAHFSVLPVCSQRAFCI